MRRHSYFHLRRGHREAIAAGVKCRFICLLASAVFLFSCRKSEQVVVAETRDATTRDVSPKLFATSDERFRDARPSPLKAITPDGWLEQPASQFRLLNYRFGESGTGEVWVSIASGSVLDNVNRWLGQFGAEPVDQAGLGNMRSVAIAGGNGTWVEASGEYSGGMRTAPRSEHALAGVISQMNGRILTVKMVGPEAEVENARATLEAFAKDLEMVR